MFIKVYQSCVSDYVETQPPIGDIGLLLTQSSSMNRFEVNVMMSSKGNIFRVTGHLCGEFTGPRWILAQRPVTRSFDVFIDLRPNKRLSKHWWDWWFERASRPLRRQCQLCVIYKQASFSTRSCMGKGKFDTKLLAIILYPVDPSYAQLKRRHLWSNRNRYGNTSGVIIHLSNPARLWTQQCSGNHCT